MIPLAAASLLVGAAALLPDVAAPGVPRPGVAEFGALEPGVATWASEGGVATGVLTAPRDPFAPAALAPENVDLLLSFTNAATARRALLQRPAGAALGALLRESAATSVWRPLVARLEDARRSPATERVEPPIQEPQALEESGGSSSGASVPSLIDPEFDRFLDELFGQEATLVARRGQPSDADHSTEWAVITKVERESLEPLLDRLSPQVLGGGWRELAGTELTYTFRRNLLVLAPSTRPRLGEEVVTLIDGGGARLSGTSELAAAREIASDSAGQGRALGSAVATMELFVRQASVDPAGAAQAPEQAGWAALSASLSSSGTLAVRHRSRFEQPMFPEVPVRAINFAALRAAAGNSTLAMVAPSIAAPGEGEGGGDSDGGAFRALSPEVSRVSDGAAAGSPLETLAGIVRLPAFVVVAPAAGASSVARPSEASPSSILREIAEQDRAVSIQEAKIAAHVGGGRRDAASVVRRGVPGDFPRERSDRSAGRSSPAKPSLVRFVASPAGEFIVVGEDEESLGQIAARLSTIDVASGAESVALRLRSMGSTRGVDLAHELGLRGADDPASMRWLAPVARTFARLEWRVVQPDSRTLEVGAEIELAPRGAP